MGGVRSSSSDSYSGETAGPRARADYSRTSVQRRLRRGIRAVPTYVLLFVFLLVAVIPFIIVVIAAFKTRTEVVQGVFSLPEVWTSPMPGLRRASPCTSVAASSLSWAW
jgi:ABC-type glycerol-3-phosphate transport system permease component